MEHEDAQDLLSDYHDGVLSHAQRTEISGHLAACQTCRVDFALIMESESLIRRMLVHPTADETERLVGAVRRELEPAPELVWLGKALSSPQRVLPVFAVLITALLMLTRPRQIPYGPAEALLISQDDGFTYRLLTSGLATLLALEAQ